MGNEEHRWTEEGWLRDLSYYYIGRASLYAQFHPSLYEK